MAASYGKTPVEIAGKKYWLVLIADSAAWCEANRRLGKPWMCKCTLCWTELEGDDMYLVLAEDFRMLPPSVIHARDVAEHGAAGAVNRLLEAYANYKASKNPFNRPGGRA